MKLRKRTNVACAVPTFSNSVILESREACGALEDYFLYFTVYR